MDEMPLEMIFGNYVAWEAKEGTWFLNFMNGSENMYLLEGEEKALLIDTGYAVGNLRAFVEKLTDKPLLVVNTHFHPDHAAGNGEFEEVMMSWNYKVDEPSVTAPGSGPFPIEALPHPDYKKILLKDGDVIELGGRTIEVLDAKPAHCNSSLFFLDRKERMLFCGDDFEAAQVMMYDNSNNPDAPYEVRERLMNFRANAQRLKGLSDAYDWLLPNHNGYPIAKSYLDDYISLVDAVFAGTAAIEDKLNHPFVDMDPRAPLLCRVRYGKGSIFILKDELMKVYGTGEV
ncbi:MAG: MBL fold metallo-hydrolase [Lachnospiraceae bacterium]|nr:MBL fold metallo-hydrolase [Lachnospiraceae bacterium]